MDIETMKVSDLQREITELEARVGNKRLYGADAAQDALSPDEEKLDALKRELDLRNLRWPVPARPN
jgi:hypothetical protein